MLLLFKTGKSRHSSKKNLFRINLKTIWQFNYSILVFKDYYKIRTKFRKINFLIKSKIFNEDIQTKSNGIIFENT